MRVDPDVRQTLKRVTVAQMYGGRTWPEWSPEEGEEDAIPYWDARLIFRWCRTCCTVRLTLTTMSPLCNVCTTQALGVKTERMPDEAQMTLFAAFRVW